MTCMAGVVNIPGSQQVPTRSLTVPAGSKPDLLGSQNDPCGPTTSQDCNKLVMSVTVPAGSNSLGSSHLTGVPRPTVSATTTIAFTSDLRDRRSARMDRR